MVYINSMPIILLGGGGGRTNLKRLNYYYSPASTLFASMLYLVTLVLKSRKGGLSQPSVHNPSVQNPSVLCMSHHSMEYEMYTKAKGIMEQTHQSVCNSV